MAFLSGWHVISYLCEPVSIYVSHCARTSRISSSCICMCRYGARLCHNPRVNELSLVGIQTLITAVVLFSVRTVLGRAFSSDKWVHHYLLINSHLIFIHFLTFSSLCLSLHHLLGHAEMSLMVWLYHCMLQYHSQFLTVFKLVPCRVYQKKKQCNIVCLLFKMRNFIQYTPLCSIQIFLMCYKVDLQIIYELLGTSPVFFFPPGFSNIEFEA